MEKQFAVDFWVNYTEGDDPDRTDFSDNRKTLEDLAKKLAVKDKEYDLAILHVRIAPEPKEERWKELERWPK